MIVSLLITAAMPLPSDRADKSVSMAPNDMTSVTTPSGLCVSVTKPLPEHLAHLSTPGATDTTSRFQLMLTAVLTHLPTELTTMSEVPCMSQALYTGLLSFGLVFGMGLLRTRRLSSMKYGVYSFFATSILSWEYCRFKLKFALNEGYQLMKNLQGQAPYLAQKEDPHRPSSMVGAKRDQ